MERMNLVGQRYTRLLVVSFAEYRVNSSGRKISYWNCKCDCGKNSVVSIRSLRGGYSRSCGCLRRDSLFKHGMIKDPVYKAWCSMIERCSNPNNPRYHAYGGRGIKVCKEWLIFENFYSDIGDRPDGCSLDRINVNGNYEPANCRWASYKQQNRNRRDNRVLEFNGEVKCLAEWAEFAGIKTPTLLFRLKAGWSIEKALTKPVRQRTQPYLGVK